MTGGDRITVNGRSYALPRRPVVGVCIDGCDPAYLEAAAGVMPELARLAAGGARGTARTVVPSFTNPNNASIATGAPPAVHGIPGNYYYDRESGEEVMMNDPRWLRCPTLLAGFAEAGAEVAVVTAKDKLLAFLSEGLPGRCFRLSVEKAGEEGASLVGRPAPGIYDPEASVYCLEAGACLLERGGPLVTYLSTTDYVQHRFAPEDPEALDFHARLDAVLGRLHRAGAVVAVTADHGMNAKTRPDGSPRVEYLESLLKSEGVSGARVILPITDPYVVHHGALGSYATVYVEPGSLERAARILAEVPGVEAVLTRDEAAALYELPPDRIGDLVVLAGRGTVLGRTPEWHDLSHVSEGLRSHGGLHEATVPFVVNRPLRQETAEALERGELRNYDLFDVLCNGTCPGL